VVDRRTFAVDAISQAAGDVTDFWALNLNDLRPHLCSQRGGKGFGDYGAGGNDTNALERTELFRKKRLGSGCQSIYSSWSAEFD
jgi:hypothetical protein